MSKFSCSSVNSHSLDFKHRLMVFFHKVLFMSKFSTDVLNWQSLIILFWVEVEGLCHAGNLAACLSVVVGWEDFCESISHSKLSVKCPSKVSLSFV